MRYTRYTVTVVDTERVMTFRAVTHCYGVAHLPSVMPSSCEEPICLMNIGRGNGRILRKSLPANGCNGVTRFFAVFSGIPKDAWGDAIGFSIPTGLKLSAQGQNTADAGIGTETERRFLIGLNCDWTVKADLEIGAPVSPFNPARPFYPHYHRCSELSLQLS